MGAPFGPGRGGLDVWNDIAAEDLEAGTNAFYVSVRGSSATEVQLRWSALAEGATILGYNAHNPPLRYIPEVIITDRERYSEIRKISGFVPVMPSMTIRGPITET
ncbi:hypothetical protein ASE85_18300 [Sphingobium sp. Leaf26]|uniref:hypothetical protein n=1 Tax=Sphingobium sp. Leaf26 TaxID=1735693 RepID=UPI0006F374FB|nr:hypothetical protein [Sphingobium sp. Leaf26]KQN07547.1 hypothetical protein ASE85_18300 [Sphingobium sp. Leaf26]